MLVVRKALNLLTSLKRKKLSLFLTLCAVLIFIQSAPEQTRHLSRDTSRLVMHTYYDKNNIKTNIDLLDRWKQAWILNGFKTHVLTLQDAKKHPDFSSSKPKLHPYLAMAMTKSGGWYSDSRTLPIEHELTDDNLQVSPMFLSVGKFTSYDSDRSLSLVSGTASEWTKVASWLILHPKESGKSNEIKSIVTVRDDMIATDVLKTNMSLRNPDAICRLIDHKLAIYVSDIAWYMSFYITQFHQKCQQTCYRYHFYNNTIINSWEFLLCRKKTKVTLTVIS